MSVAVTSDHITSVYLYEMAAAVKRESVSGWSQTLSVCVFCVLCSAVYAECVKQGIKYEPQFLLWLMRFCIS